MDTLKDIWASLVTGVQERTTNPLTFSFIASWCLWNFKFFIILAGDGTTAQRLHAVDALYPLTVSTYLGHALLAPLLTACAYVFWYPSISQRVIDFYRKKQVAIANSVREIERKRLLTVEESSRLIRDFETERNELHSRETRLSEQLSQVRTALEAAEKQVRELESAKVVNSTTEQRKTVNLVRMTANENRLADSKVTAQLHVDHIRPQAPNIPKPLPLVPQMIVKLLSASSTPLTSGEISSRLDLNHSVTLVALEDMESWEVSKSNKVGQWELTPEGHRLAVALIGGDSR